MDPSISVQRFSHKYAVVVALAVGLRRAARYSTHVNQRAAVEHIRAQGTACGDTDLRQVRAAAEGVIADGRAAVRDGHHRQGPVLEGLGFRRPQVMPLGKR